ncbi:MAG: AAA family ATPase [Candidatus Zixiibacteriota bacterium]
MTARIVITGAPSSGKTEFLGRLRREPALSRFVFLDEMAREMLCENPEYRENWQEFHIEIYRRQVSREESLSCPFVTDRGTLDALAFHRQTLELVNSSAEVEYRRYTAIVQVGSAANLGEGFYRVDQVRQESIAQALELEEELRNIWSSHPEYHFVSAEPDIDSKYERFSRLIFRLCEKDLRI